DQTFSDVEDYTVIITPAVQDTFLVPEEYGTIQAAIDAATPGAQVLVNSGTYHEDIVIDKPLVLKSNFGPSKLTFIRNKSKS
ncbi:MAG: hypothetical protein JKY19_03955, partial [Alcanivoracaceae bacterium]|nr:hypothetical protein [Alcanivoracaceae bacterium]